MNIFINFFSPHELQCSSNRGMNEWVKWKSTHWWWWLAGGLLGKAKKFVWTENFLHTSLAYAFVFRLCFTLNYGIIYRDRHMCEHIQTFIHDERWTFPFSTPTIIIASLEDECRDSLSRTECVSLFSKISPRGFTIKFSYSISHAMHTPKI